MNPLSTFDKEYYIQYQSIAGIDEAGRGTLAGPVVACACALKPSSLIIPDINDSKKLSEKKRILLAKKIKEHCFIGIGIVNEKTIDKINILQATYLAMQNALIKLENNTDLSKINFALIDGRDTPKLSIPSIGIIKGDSKSYLIACASIIAKVTRDNIMFKYAKKFPKYQFEKHKGYGTKVHRKAIHKHGLTPIHRKSFRCN